MIDFQRVNGWYKNSFGWGFSGDSFRGLSLPGRPAHTLTYPWPAKIPCQLRSPKDIINPKIFIFWEKMPKNAKKCKLKKMGKMEKMQKKSQKMQKKCKKCSKICAHTVARKILLNILNLVKFWKLSRNFTTFPIFWLIALRWCKGTHPFHCGAKPSHHSARLGGWRSGSGGWR